MNAINTLNFGEDYLVIGQNWGESSFKKLVQSKSVKEKAKKSLKESFKPSSAEKPKINHSKIEGLKILMRKLEMENHRLAIENTSIKEENLSLGKVNKEIIHNISLQKKCIMRLNVEVDRLKQNLHNVSFDKKPRSQNKKQFLSNRQRLSSIKRFRISHTPEVNKSFDGLMHQIKLTYFEKSNN